MKLSIFTTVKWPEQRGDLYEEPWACYKNLADEVVEVDGDELEYDEWIKIVSEKRRIIRSPWAKEFRWEFIGQQFQRGYEACTGDWVIHADLDFIFHENDYEAIRMACEQNSDAPGISFWKYQFILPDRYILKSRLVLAVNKAKYGDRIRFDSGGDLCQPSLDGNEIKPDDVPEARIPFYNYEKLLKTESQIKDDVGRMARAWQKHFGEYKLGGPDDESAYEEWWKMTAGRYDKDQEHIDINKHPKVMQETIKNLQPNQFGYNGFGMLKGGYHVEG